jgi:hypothetical protein
MNKKIIVIILLLISLIFCVLGYFATKYSKDIVIENSTIQNEINQKIPIKKHFLIGEIVADKVSVDINNSVNILIHGHTNILNDEKNFTAETNGEITYNNSKFYFHPNKFNIHFETTESISQNNEQNKNKIFSFIKNKTKNIGMNQINIENKINEVISDGIIDIPVYSLKEGFIKASLSDVKIIDNSIHIKMSIMELTKYAILYIGGVLITLLTAISLMLSIINKNKNGNNKFNDVFDILGDVA